MTDLTEQWINIYKSKKHGSYWTGAFCYKTKEEAVKDLADKENYLTTVNIEDMLNLQTQNAQLKEYERIVTSYNMKPIDYDIACETVNKLLDDNKRLKHDVGNLGYKIKNQRKEIERQIAQNAQLKEQINKYCLDAINRGTANAVKAVKEFGMLERIKELVKQNVQLKELLKECREVIKNVDTYYGNYDSTNGYLVINKIDEVLK